MPVRGSGSQGGRTYTRKHGSVSTKLKALTASWLPEAPHARGPIANKGITVLVKVTDPDCWEEAGLQIELHVDTMKAGQGVSAPSQGIEGAALRTSHPVLIDHLNGDNPQRADKQRIRPFRYEILYELIRRVARICRGLAEGQRRREIAVVLGLRASNGRGPVACFVSSCLYLP